MALRVDDIARYDSGIELLIRRSKTDQEAAGRTVFIPHGRGLRCPVRALEHWLQVAAISEGHVFRQVSRHDRLLGDKPLVPESVALIVKAAVRASAGEAAADAVSGHSLRAGFCTEAAQAGLPNYLIRGQTGHRGDASLAKYIRPVSQRKIPTLL